MVFIKNYKQTKEHKEKLKKSRLSKNGVGICIGCGETFGKYHKTERTCGKKECKLKADSIKYFEVKSANPIMGKAVSLSGTVRLGKGKKEAMFNLLNSNLNTPCKYCNEIITLENASLDHKTPRENNKVFNKKAGSMTYTSEEIKKLDSIENLQIICRICNLMKSNFNNEEYIILLDFLKDKPIMKAKLFKRLKIGITGFRKF